MTETAAKDFGLIEGDYDFFMETSTEAECDLTAYRPFVDALTARLDHMRMLDFGCGGGDFSEAFLNQASWPVDRLTLDLVEPVEMQRQRAAKRLGRFTQSPIDQWPLMPDEPFGPFDLILSNHVFYYVTDLDREVVQLRDALAPNGLFLIALAGKTNALFPFWQLAFELSGKEIPYHVSEDLEATFERLAIDYDREIVAYDMAFPDSTENRMKILRFLFADHLAELPVEPLLALFDPCVKNGQVDMPTSCQHYVIRAQG